jgi:signal transduction histidine kinase
MSATRSLRSRLAWSATAVLALWVAALTVGADLLLGVALAHQTDSLLAAQANAVAGTISTGADGLVSVAPDDDDAALDVGTWVFTANGTMVESPPRSTPELDAEAAALGATGATTSDGGLTEPVRLYALPVRQAGRTVATVVTSTSLVPYRRVQTLAWVASGVLALGLMAGMHVLLRANVSRALRPVREMTAQATRWSADEVDRRFGAAPRPAELDELARSLDTVLERLGAVLRRERQLTDELSHELRTPLTQVQAEVELLRTRSRDRGEQDAAHAAIGRAAGEMQRIIDTLMASARVAAGSLSGRSHARPVLDSLAERLRAARPDLDVSVRVAPPDCSVGVEQVLLERLLSPIVENAGRYARHRVELTGEPVDRCIRVLVADDGPGVPPADRDDVFAPGWRGTPADGHGGAGLGLALARRLAETAGGVVTVLPGGTGGRFAVDLPMA